MGNYSKTLGEGFSGGQLAAALNYNDKDNYGGQKIGGIYQDGVLLPGKSVQNTYRDSTTQNYLLGSRRITLDGRVYRYALAGAACASGFGCKNFGAYSGVTGGAVTTTVDGDDKVVILLDATTGGATWFGTAGRMIGGYMSMPTGTLTLFRIITDHSTGASGGYVTITLDGPLTRAVTATNFMEIAQNPYADVRQTNNLFTSVMGVAVGAIASGSYGWIQTWGPCWCIPALPVADTSQWRTVTFGGDGSILSYEDSTGETGLQVAGFVIDNTSPGSDNPPFIMLQISP